VNKGGTVKHQASPLFVRGGAFLFSFFNSGFDGNSFPTAERLFFLEEAGHLSVGPKSVRTAAFADMEFPRAHVAFGPYFTDVNLLSRFGSAGIVPEARKPKSFYRRNELW